MHSVIRLLLTLAAVWAIIAGFFIFFAIGGMQATELANGEGQPIIVPISWFESQGWWGLAILFIFATLFYGPLHFYNRKQIALTVTFGIVAMVISILSGFSIGNIYWPGSLALLIGLVLLLFRK